MQHGEHTSASRILRWTGEAPDPAVAQSLEAFARWASAQQGAWYAERWPIIAGHLYGEPGSVTEIPDTRAEAIAIGDFGVIALRRAHRHDNADKVREDNDQLAAELLYLLHSCPGVYRRRRVVVAFRVAACAARAREHDHEHAAGEHLEPQVLESWRASGAEAMPQATQRACRERLLPRTAWRYQREAPADERERLLALALDPARGEGAGEPVRRKAIALRAVIAALAPDKGLQTVQLPPGLDSDARAEAAQHARFFAETHVNQSASIA